MIKFYNTLTKKLEKFKPFKKNELKIYSCGPTVYSRQHIGNLYSVIIWDTLKNIFRYFDYKIIDVINITDVGHLTDDGDDGEDKLEKKSREEKKDIYQIAEKFENLYIKDLKRLNITLPKFMPRATEHIEEQKKIIEVLYEKGLTYKTQDGIYFDTQKSKNYGILSNKNIDEKNLKARIKKNNEKKHSFDFALWKFCVKENLNHQMRWNNPIYKGEGFPGWHLECSAMAEKYLGENFDIHTGGVEHISIHHEAEISQSKNCFKNFQVNFWLHNQHLLIENEKMSKSLKNDYNLDNLKEKGFDYLDFRFFVLKEYYRQSTNFTFEKLKVAKNELKKIREFCFELKSKSNSRENNFNLKNYIFEFEENISNDLKINNSIGTIFKLIKECKKNDIYTKDILDFFKKIDKIFMCNFFDKKDNKISKEIIDLANKRIEFKENKNFEMADKIRDKIKDLGFIIIDKKDGFEIKKI